MIHSDHALHWALSDMIEQAEGGGTLTGFYALAEGESVLIEVDHSDQAVFEFAEVPRFGEIPGAEVTLDLSGTDGSGFRVRVTRSDDVAGGEPGYGSDDVAYTWTRRGGLQ